MHTSSGRRLVRHLRRRAVRWVKEVQPRAKKISKKFPGAKITFPKLVKCKISHIDEFATIYVHAKVPEHKELPLNELVKASYSQRGVEGNQIEIPAIDSTQLSESF